MKAAAQAPAISFVRYILDGRGYDVRIVGSGFGHAPRGVPCTGCTSPYLSGFDGPFNIVWWNDRRIIILGAGASPGAQATVAVTNPSTGKIAAWSGYVSPVHPVISSVVFSGSGVNLGITVNGSGFGAAPPGIPGKGDTPCFQFTHLSGAWHAGYVGNGQTDTVGLNYTSWTDTQIVISGFTGNFITGGFVVAPGDVLSVTLWDGKPNDIPLAAAIGTAP
jgi:hypothetical protein